MSSHGHTHHGIGHGHSHGHSHAHGLVDGDYDEGPFSGLRPPSSFQVLRAKVSLYVKECWPHLVVLFTLAAAVGYYANPWLGVAVAVVGAGCEIHSARKCLQLRSDYTKLSAETAYDRIVARVKTLKPDELIPELEKALDADDVDSVKALLKEIPFERDSLIAIYKAKIQKREESRQVFSIPPFPETLLLLLGRVVSDPYFTPDCPDFHALKQAQYADQAGPLWKKFSFQDANHSQYLAAWFFLKKERSLDELRVLLVGKKGEYRYELPAVSSPLAFQALFDHRAHDLQEEDFLFACSQILGWKPLSRDDLALSNEQKDSILSGIITTWVEAHPDFLENTGRVTTLLVKLRRNQREFPTSFQAFEDQLDRGNERTRAIVDNLNAIASADASSLPKCFDPGYVLQILLNEEDAEAAKAIAEVCKAQPQFFETAILFNGSASSFSQDITRWFSRSHRSATLKTLFESMNNPSSLTLQILRKYVDDHGYPSEDFKAQLEKLLSRVKSATPAAAAAPSVSVAASVAIGRSASTAATAADAAESSSDSKDPNP